MVGNADNVCGTGNDLIAAFCEAISPPNVKKSPLLCKQYRIDARVCFGCVLTVKIDLPPDTWLERGMNNRFPPTMFISYV